MAAALVLSPLVLASPRLEPPFNQNEHKSINKDPTPFGSFKNCKTLEEIKRLHSNMKKKGLFHKPSDLNKLIASCIEMGNRESLDYARNAFELFNEDERTLFMYNCLIRGYASSGHGEEAVFLYIEMVVNGISPDKFTFPFLLSACAKVWAFMEGIQVHGAVLKMGLGDDIFIQNSLVHFYGECGKIDLGRKVFDGMCERNVVSWTSMICGYARNDLPKLAVSLFFEMMEGGIKPNSVTMVCVISACAKLKDLELGRKLRAYIDKSGMKLNTVLENSLVDMYMKCGDTSSAQQLFDECGYGNLILCNTIMSNYVRHGLAREALLIFNEMLQLGPQPDRVTMLSAISACAELGDFSSGKSCHGYVMRNGLEGWDSICNAMIDMYMKCGKRELGFRVFLCMSNKTVVSWNSLISGLIKNEDIESAWDIFNEMPERDIVSWNTMIGALVQESMFKNAIELFRVMQLEGVKADRVTMVGIASACGYLGALDLAKWVYTYIKKHNIQCDMHLGTAMVDMFSRCGDCRSAMYVFDKMEKKDVSAWTAAIAAMAMVGNGKRALELFDKMLGQGVKPDKVVFVAVLTACSHGGLVDQGRHLFSSIKETHGICPQMIHYGCIVDLLGRAGLFEEALDLIKSMPVEPNDIIWGSLLAACRVHKNVELASHAAKRIAQMAPDRTGIQVLLSNVYASSGQWTNVAKVRLNLKEKGMQKVPGSSSIEVNGIIHEFTSGEESHRESTHIASMLSEINCRLSDAGHVPDLTNVLLDVDEQDKGYFLSRHSEKLAIAYGLISTNQGMPIRVIKNLRICSDCHSFAKLVSKIYNRELAIRDNNRFHFFKNGFCSCGDYW